MTHKITNESRLGRSYTASNGQRIHFAPGETKELNSLPPEDEDGWRIEATEENQKPEKTEEDGGEN